MALLLLGLACHVSADLGIVYALDATTVRLSASGNTSALQEPLKVAFALRQHVPATTVSDIIEDLDPWDITHSFSAGTVALMFGWWAVTNASGTETTIALCTKQQTSLCILPGYQYDVTAIVTDANSTTLSAGTLLPPFSRASNAPNVTVATDQESLLVSWQQSQPIVNHNNTVTSYSIFLRCDSEGNARSISSYSEATPLPVRIIINQTVPTTTTSVNITGCFPTDTGAAHCIYPWTVYQVEVRAIGTQYDEFAAVLAVTQQGRRKSDFN